MPFCAAVPMIASVFGSLTSRIAGPLICVTLRPRLRTRFTNAGSSVATFAGSMWPGYAWTVGQTPPHTISMAASATSSAERIH